LSGQYEEGRRIDIEEINPAFLWENISKRIVGYHHGGEFSLVLIGQ